MQTGTSDLAMGPAYLRRVTAIGGLPLVRIYRPRPVVAFGGRDRVNPGYDRAVDAALRHGFLPVLRAPGGHAVAYTPASVCIEFSASEAEPHAGTQERFTTLTGLIRDALQNVGVATEMGAAVDEYCPGDYSLGIAGQHKIAGTAQRIVRGGWMFGAGIVCGDGERVRDVLTDVYGALALPFDPQSVLPTTDVSPAATADACITALREVLDAHFQTHPWDDQGDPTGSQ